VRWSKIEIDGPELNDYRGIAKAEFKKRQIMTNLVYNKLVTPLYNGLN
jgi:hypothetical protein